MSKKPLSFEGVHQFLRTLFADDLHAKRVLSLAGTTMRVIESASLAVAMIGQGSALARGRLTKHAIKPALWSSRTSRVCYGVGARIGR